MVENMCSSLHKYCLSTLNIDHVFQEARQQAMGLCLAVLEQ